MADSLQIAAGRKANMSRLPYRSFGYCYDAGELWIGGPASNVLLAATETFTRLTELEGAVGTLQAVLAAQQETINTLEQRVAALEGDAT